MKTYLRYEEEFSFLAEVQDLVYLMGHYPVKVEIFQEYGNPYCAVAFK